MKMKTTFLLLALSLCAAVLAAADPGAGDCPMHAKHTAAATAAAEIDRRGDQAMGFSQQKNKHTFRLFADGGAIEVRGSEVESIRAHMKEVAVAFTAGDFDKPQFIHGRVPDGVEVMKRSAISYRYEELPQGGRVRIATEDAAALEAVHAFLRFQIDDHRTGDSTAVSPLTSSAHSHH